ncbi:MAG: replicative DNA helicase [Chloroflexi bacterium]|nr:replicative DNA helicase [Chloroflexota bacterium]
MADRDLSLPPHSIQAEEAVLGSVLKNPLSIVRISDFLKSEDFYQARHRHIFGAMLRLTESQSPLDYHTIADELQRMGVYEASGGLLYLSELNLATPTAAHIEHYARIIERTSIMRKLISASATIAEIAFRDNLDPDTALEKAEQMVLSIAERRVTRDFRSLEDVLSAYMDQVEAMNEGEGARYGIPSGYIDLDRILGGFQRTDLIILAARTSVGKTSFALNLAVNAAVKARASVAIFSLEMSAEQLASRLLSMESGVDSPRIRGGKLNEHERSKLSHALGFLAEAPIWVDDTPSIPIMELRSKARRLQAEHGVDMIIIDYLQLIVGDSGDGRVQEIGQISRALKALARELRVPIIALSQLSRAVEQRTPHIPMLSDLRESGCLTGDTLVYLPDPGRYVPIAQLVGRTGFRVLALNTDTWRLEPRLVTNAFPTGTKPVFRLTSRLGRTIRATANHQFLTMQGWQRLDHLLPGMRLALPRTLPGPQSQTLGDSRLAFLGHLLGDGCTLPRHALQYTTNDPLLAETVSRLAIEAFGDAIEPRIRRERQWLQVFLTSTERLGRGRRNPIALWLSELGAFGLRSHDKRIPDIVFAQPSASIARFLRHLWSTDGCIHLSVGQKHYAGVYYATSSWQLASGVQSLLLRLNINATLVRHAQPGKGRDQFHVVVSGQDEILRFLDDVGALGTGKQKHADLLREHFLGRVANTNRDVVPHAAWRSLVVPAMQQIGMTTRQMQARMETHYCGTALYKTNLSRERAARVAHVSQSPELASLAGSDVYWDEIIAIQPDGEDAVYDLTVDGLHNFVAANIVVHNSIEQDADVVLFIYRDEKYNPDTEKKGVAEIHVAKHRNGPTGKVDLLFLDRTTKFLDLEVFKS